MPMILRRRSALRHLWAGSASQVAGRVALSAFRLLLSALVVPLSGVDLLGEYTLLLTFLTLAEWLAEFGQTDLVVRGAA